MLFIFLLKKKLFNNDNNIWKIRNIKNYKELLRIKINNNIEKKTWNNNKWQHEQKMKKKNINNIYYMLNLNSFFKILIYNTITKLIIRKLIDHN